MTPIYTGQPIPAPPKHNEALSDAIKRREEGHVTSDLIRKEQGRMEIEKEKE